MFVELKDITIFVLLLPLANTYITYKVSECILGKQTISLSSSRSYSSAGILMVSEEGFQTLPDCNITLIAPFDHRIVISFRKINLRKENGECLDYLKIWTSKYSPIMKCGNYKYSKEQLSFQSSGNTLSMVYHTDKKFSFGEIGFSLTFTACFYRGYSSTCKNSNNFQCDNLCCIYDSLKCDGHNNCGDSSDESPSGNSYCKVLTAGEVAGIALGAIVAVIIVFATVVICRRKRRTTLSYIRTPTVCTAPPPYTSTSSSYPYNSNVYPYDYTNHQMPPSYEAMGYAVHSSNGGISNPMYSVNSTDPTKLTT